MLRWLFLILLLLNGMLYGWFYQEQEQRRARGDRVQVPVAAVAQIELVSEVADSRLRKHESKPRPKSTPKPKPRPVWYCHRFGGFEEALDLNEWLSKKAPGKITLEQVQLSALPSVYGVYIRADQRAEARQELLESMQAIGLEGEWADAEGLKGLLTLGVYEEAVSAEALHQALKQQGYDASVRERKRYRHENYLLLRTRSESVSGSSWVKSLLKQYPVIKSEKKRC